MRKKQQKTYTQVGEEKNLKVDEKKYINEIPFYALTSKLSEKIAYESNICTKKKTNRKKKNPLAKEQKKMSKNKF